MTEERNIATVTSENLAEFHQQHLAARTPVADMATEKPDESGSATEKTDEPPKDDESKPNKLEKRFSKITAERESARAEAQREREARERLEAEIATLKGKPAEAQEAQKEPHPGEYADAFEYAKALAAHEVQKALSQRDADKAQQQQKAEQQKVVDTWSQRLAAVKQELPDFEDMVASSDISVGNHVRDAIMDSEAGPRILYHLAEHPELAEKINTLSPIAAVREIGKLEVQLTKKDDVPPAAKPAVSKAPPPITPVKGGSAATDAKVNGQGEFTGSYAEFKALRQAGKLK